MLFVCGPYSPPPPAIMPVLVSAVKEKITILWSFAPQMSAFFNILTEILADKKSFSNGQVKYWTKARIPFGINRAAIQNEEQYVDSLK